jgi:hypothetical protein
MRDFFIASVRKAAVAAEYVEAGIDGLLLSCKLKTRMFCEVQ